MKDEMMPLFIDGKGKREEETSDQCSKLLFYAECAEDLVMNAFNFFNV